MALVMTCSKTAYHAVASQATAGVSLYFRYFPADRPTKNSLVFAAWQVPNN